MPKMKTVRGMRKNLVTTNGVSDLRNMVLTLIGVARLAGACGMIAKEPYLRRRLGFSRRLRHRHQSCCPASTQLE
jgi:hypothetical protein